jgi:hypothetical protein
MATFRGKPGEFLRLYPVNDNGEGEEVDVNNLPPELQFGNGGSWLRRDSKFAQTYIIEKTYERGRIKTIQLKGYSNKEYLDQSIRPDIRRALKGKRCVATGSSNNIEIDHKDGRKDDLRVMNLKTQKIEDFQPLTKESNDIKRQRCKECKKADKRYDATELGFHVPVICGTIEYDSEIKCKGCFWYDPVEFRKALRLRQ